MMATLTKARTLSSGGSLRPTQLQYCQQGIHPVAALLTFRREYWTSKGSDYPYRSSSYTLTYSKLYPAHACPSYTKHIDGLTYGYSRKSVSQPFRMCSNGARKERQQKKPEDNNKFRPQETPWERRTRLAGEKYLLLMEEYMALLRKDPYWALFGGAELRGVWNPWKSTDRLRKRLFDGELWEESPPPSTPKPYMNHDVPKAAAPTDDVLKDYYIDPVTNKRVMRARPVSSGTELETRTKPLPPRQSFKTTTTPVKQDALSMPMTDLGKDEIEALFGGEKRDSKSSPCDKPLSIPVKKFSPSMRRESQERENFKVMMPSRKASQAPLTGFARQPWLVQEGFIPPEEAQRPVNTNLGIQGPGSLTSSPSAWEKTRKEAEAARAKATRNNKHVAGQAGSNQSTMPARLSTALSRSLTNKKELAYDETPDRREDLDLLRSSDVRAASGKTTTKSTQESPLARQRRWTEIEKTVAVMFQGREDRLAKEFAADKWEIKRTMSAYPGEIPKTPEELRARRRLLERSYNNSMNMLELNLSKVLDVSGAFSLDVVNACQKETPGLSSAKTAPSSKEAADVRSYYNAQYEQRMQAQREEQLKKRQATDRYLQKEIIAQKAAMTAHESRPRVGFTSSTTGPMPDPVSMSPVVEESSSSTEESKAKERALISEIKSIYEDAYGTTDTALRQSVKRSPAKMSEEASKTNALMPSPETTLTAVAKSLSEHESKYHTDIHVVKYPAKQPTKAVEKNLVNHKQGDGVDVYNENLAITKVNMPKLEPPQLKSGSTHYPFDSEPGYAEPGKQQQAADVLNAARVELNEPYTATMPTNVTDKAGLKPAKKIERIEDIEELAAPVAAVHKNSAVKSGEDPTRPTTASHSGEVAKPRREPEVIQPAATERTIVTPKETESGPEDTVKQPMETKAAKRPITPERTEQPQSYILLAYDKEEKKVRVIRTHSSIHENSAPARTIDSILSRLDNPGSYFDHMERLEKSGYELVAGSRKLLVYKDALNRAADHQIELPQDEPSKLSRGWGVPAEEASKALISNAADAAQEHHTSSETVTSKSPSSSPIYIPPSQPVRRVEEKFSGLPRRAPPPSGYQPSFEDKESSQERRQSSPHLLTRLLRGALVVGAVFYTFGVSLEWMKDRERRKLEAEYRQEVARVKEVERRKNSEREMGRRFVGWNF